MNVLIELINLNWVDMAFCIKCGNELVDGDRFCRRCGTLINDSSEQSHSYDEASGNPRDYQAAKSVRLDKCPACGEPLRSSDKVCPACDYQIAELIVSSAVNEFVQNLSEMEARAIDGRASYIAVVKEIDGASIPHTIAGARAFLSLAEGRVCTSIRDYGQGREAKRAVLEAWTTKSQQVYEVAKLSLFQDPEFESVERIYQKINAVASAKNALNNVASVSNTLRNSGCLGRWVWFVLVMALLSVAISLLRTVTSNFIEILLIVAVVVVGLLIFQKKKDSN